MRSELVNSFITRVNNTFPKNQADMILNAVDMGLGVPVSDMEECISIAELIMEHKADHIVITALFLAPLRKIGGLDHKNILDHFGDATADLVESLQDQSLSGTESRIYQRENVRKLLDSFSRDIRSSVLMISLRIFRLERSCEAGDGDIESLARESMEFYVPLADRLGMGAMRSRLEDVCFRILEPEVYGNIKEAYEPIQIEDKKCLDLLRDVIEKLLKRNGINGAVHGRTKGIYSLYRKMCSSNLSLRNITDKIGLRIIVSSVPQCYSVLGLLHTYFQPVQGTFKDYIGLPKENGYRSIHTCIYPVREISHKPVELQIRTEAMHTDAVFGVAAHWLYKTEKDAAMEQNRQLNWMRNLIEEHESSESHDAFLDRLQDMVYRDEIVVFGLGAGQMRLPAGSTVLDFARRTGRSNGKVRVLVNGKPASMISKLRDGDTVALESSMETQ